jgi:hypothetical protein
VTIPLGTQCKYISFHLILHIITILTHVDLPVNQQSGCNNKQIGKKLYFVTTSNKVERYRLSLNTEMFRFSTLAQ